MNSINDYREYLVGRFQDKQLVETLWIAVCGYVVKLNFYGMNPGDVMRTNLRSLLVEPQLCANETVSIWEDDLTELASKSVIPEERRFIHYHQTDEYHVLFPGIVERLAVRDNAAHVTFVVFENGTMYPESYVNKPFVNELQWWLWDSCLLLHGAAVGAHGVGVLITAPSGKGKSTLALACLLEGMDFVAEDYVLVDRTGPIVVHPILSTGFLTAQTLKMLPALKSGVIFHAPLRDKYLIDLNGFGKGLTNDLLLHVMIYPVIAHMAEPSFTRATSVQPFMAAVTTTVKQIKSQDRTVDAFKVLFARLKDMPAYEMYLTDDPVVNAGALRSFLRALSEGGEHTL